MSRVTYQEAETYISELPKFTKKNTLEHTQKFLSFLGNPQNGKKVIHVAGTNGKGSVCVYLDAMLRAQRKHTGLFTSPHLIRMNERIRMDGEPVSDETFTRLFLRTQQSVRRMEAEGLPHPSFFEFLFGMAMAGFEEAGVEYVILETGLGGRLDATNSISGPLTCILTSIGLDHTEILGNTLEEIAAEKAGILKPHVPVIFADTQQESSRVIEERAGELGCPCKKIGKSAYEILKIQDGTAALKTTEVIPGAPFIEGLELNTKKVKMNKKLPVTDQDIFERIVEVTRLSNKYELSSDRLTCSDGGVNLIFGVVTVQLGKGNYEMKIAQISPILEKLNEKFAGQAGVLHLENYETSGTSVRFVPEKAAETEADEGQDAGQTDENQSGESEAAQTDQTSAAGTGEGETTE